MSEPDQPDDPQPQQQDRKGKGRAIILEPSEHTPLLGGTSQIPWTVVTDAEEDSSRAQRTLRARLTTVFLVSLLICIVFFVFLALLAWSYAARAADLTPQDILNNDLVFEGPDKVELHNITDDGGMWLTVHGRIGVDAGDAMGFNTDPNDGALTRLWKKIGRQSVRTLDSVSVDLSTVTVLPEFSQFDALAKLFILPLVVPLAVDPATDGSWLRPVSIPVLVYPSTDPKLITKFLKESWRHGYFAVRADVDNVLVRGGTWKNPTWRTKFHGKLSNIRTSLRLKVPPIRGLPAPGSDSPLPDPAKLITLKSFGLASSDSHLSIHAKASVPNPAPDSLQFTSPALPFVVSILDEKNTPFPVASVTASPFSLTHPNITLDLTGRVHPLQQSTLPHLSHFLMHFLNGESNRIRISPSDFPSLAVTTVFPGPDPRPHLLRNITIQDMKLKTKGGSGGFLASGKVVVNLVLPKGMKIGLDVKKVLPDVLVFDGEVPIGQENDTESLWGRTKQPPPTQPLPDPLPEKAFGRIRPEDWLEAVSEPDDEQDPEDGSAYRIEAKVVDVPLEVLPGRQKEFSNFVSKVIFTSDGALAGLQGTAAVQVKVQGLPVRNGGDHGKDGPSHLNLEGLPFTGSVRINKKSLLQGVGHEVDDKVEEHWKEVLEWLKREWGIEVNSPRPHLRV
ncbi:hypothetical protein FA15DRAFT_665510 [Coprinopsis marcescibilis]|uniref:Pre-rRNA processing protein n=1 Tax=Coprinopsis marcescibilis TaxID=230819 RepID=A0A5C3LIB6_COPMA|nr:hypothetical protein FA15DRAFT_665510 [Coprinopsis marcescibilis]